MSRLAANDQLSHQMDDAFDALAEPGVIIACVPAGTNSVRIVTGIDGLNSTEAEACALDLLRSIHTRMSEDACGACPSCQARIARIAAAMAALSEGSAAPSRGGLN